MSRVENKKSDKSSKRTLVLSTRSIQRTEILNVPILRHDKLVASKCWRGSNSTNRDPVICCKSHLAPRWGCGLEFSADRGHRKPPRNCESCKDGSSISESLYCAGEPVHFQPVISRASITNPLDECAWVSGRKTQWHKNGNIEGGLAHCAAR